MTKQQYNLVLDHEFQTFSSFSCTSEPSEDMLKHGLLGSTHRDSDSVDLGWDLKICLSNNLARDADDAGLKHT